MIYQHLFDRVREPAIVRAAVIGCGDFGAPIVTQARAVPRLEIRIVSDLDVEKARSVLQAAGAAEADISVCESARSALRAMEAGRWVIAEDASVLMDLPLHVIVTATRIPEAGARHAREAIRHGKHVVMVDKEADSVVGPLLKHLADHAGVVFTTDDGDQPGLVMGLVSWARALGFEVLCGGHFHECDYSPEAGTLTLGGSTLPIPAEDRWALECIPAGEASRVVEARGRLTSAWDALEERGDTFAHMAVTANGTGLMPDTPTGHRPRVRLAELPEALCPVEDGGLLRTRGAVELPIVLRTEEAPRVEGGVFVVISTGDARSREVMVRKGLLANRGRSALLVYRPHHLCGAETAMSILAAGLLRVPTGAAAIRPRVDIAATARRDFAAGDMVSAPGQSGYDPDLAASLIPAAPLSDDGPLPFFMLESNRVATDVPSGALITRRMVVPPANSFLWSLRQQQDAVFFRPG